MKHLASLFLSLLLILAACETTNRSAADSAQVAYNPMVSAFTSGTISRQADIIVRFAEGVSGGGVSDSGVAAEDILSFSPSIKGKASWTDERTLRFNPNEPLLSGTHYEVSVDLASLFPEEKGSSTEEFRFHFRTIPLTARIEMDAALPIDPNDAAHCNVKGRVVFSDFIAENEQLHTLKATQEGKGKSVQWDEDNDGRSFGFVIEDIARTELSTIVRTSLDADSYDMESEAKAELVVPSLTTFGMHSYKVHTLPNQVIEIAFTDPLDAEQNLDGLITLNKQVAFERDIANNIVRLYPRQTIIGDVELTLHRGIRSMSGKQMEENQLIALSLQEAKPAVEFIGRGTILPSSEGLTLPFRAVSLSKVQVRVVKIFEDNIMGFLQTNNSFDSDYDIRTAGRLILKRTITLDTDRSLDIHKWNTFSLDLDKLITLDPNALYCVELVFGMQHSAYPGVAMPAGDDLFSDEITEDEISYFDTRYGGNQYGDLGEYGNWQERNDPTKKAYYNAGRFASRNIFASNLGIIVKSGATNAWTATVTDLRTTAPLSGVEISFFNQQRQLITKGKTDKEGSLTVEAAAKPYMLAAKKDDESGYLLLEDGSALMMSNFDVQGSVMQRGLKGFIYGERGVWRPGDDLHLSFMLEDREQRLPEGHPVVLEVFNALGQPVAKRMQHVGDTDGSSQLFAFTVPTDKEAITGNWEARITVGGSVFSKRLRIETVKPNRLKINSEFRIPHSAFRIPHSAFLKATLSARWLHGAPARKLKSTVDGKLYAKRTTFKGYEDYNFDNEAASYQSEEFALFKGTLNEAGTATFSKALPKTYTSPGMLTLQVRSRVFEAGGDFSTNISTIDYSPYTNYVGVKAPKGDDYGVLLTDKNHRIDVVGIKEDGTPLTAQRNITYTIYKVDWRWWWEKSEDNLARYIGSSSKNVVKKGTVSLTNGKGSIDFMVKHPDWGRYLIVVKDPLSRHTTSTTVRIDWPGYGSKSNGDATAAAMLSVSADKEAYTVGEKAEITFPSSEGGRALISIENGTKVLKQFWAETKKDFTSYAFDLDATMSPNVYAHVTMLQPHAQTANNLPIRMYGIAPITVNNEATRLTPLIEMPQQLAPKSDVTIAVSEKEGKPMRYTLAIVEEGLLDLTNFATPKPYDHFYAREALGVKTWDIYNNVMGAYGGRIESVFGIGGSDGQLRAPDASDANRFEPVSIVLGPFELKGGRTAKHQITMPNYVGSVRTMVVACDDSRYGSAEETTPVKSPLMALATLPRMVSIDETFDLPVTLFTDESVGSKVNVSVSCEGAIALVGSKTKSVSISKAGSSTMAFFRLASSDKTGIAKVKVEAVSGSHRSDYTIEIGVRNPNTPISVSRYATIEAGETADIPFDKIGAAGTDELWIETSTIAPIDYDRRLKYLRSYPHSCVEQTVSAAFPLLYAENFCDISKEEKAEIETKISATMDKLQRYATTNGGFAYWAGETTANDWATSYVGHFLTEAQKRGYAPAVDLLGAWTTHQTKEANAWVDSPTNNTIMQTYRLYTLALAGKPNFSAMNRILSSKNLSLDATLTLAMAYAAAGRKDVAQQIDLYNREPNAPEYLYTFGSEMRTTALMLMYDKVNDHKEIEAAEIVKELSAALSSEEWFSTQDIAFAMLSLSQWMPSKGEPMRVSYQTPGSNRQSIATERPLYRKQAETSPVASGSVSFTNKGKSTLFARVISHGTPTRPLAEALSQNLSIKAEYVSLEGKPIDVQHIAQGTDFMAVITVANPSTANKATNLSLTHLIPAGWEIRNMRMEAASLPQRSDRPRYQDIRDDRILSYFDLDKGKSIRLVVLLNAAYRGTFALPSINCSAMYFDNVQATTAAGTTTIH